MELSKAIRTAYYAALDGNVLFNALPVPIYDAFAIPDNITYPYILLSSQTSNQLQIKRRKRFNASIIIDVVTGSTDPIGRSNSEDIAEKIDIIINPSDFSDLNLLAYGYQLGNTIRENDTDLADKNGLFYIFRKILTYNHLIVKL